MKQHLSPCEDPGSGLITVGQYCYSPLLTSEGHCGLDGTGHLAKVTKLVAEVGFRLSLPILRVHTASPMGLCPQAQALTPARDDLSHRPPSLQNFTGLSAIGNLL